jgi:hypothetical protein
MEGTKMRTCSALLLAGAVGLGSTIACSDTLGTEDLLGVWYATSIAGQTIPGTVSLYGLELDIQYWRWTFEASGGCTYVLQYADDVETRDGEYTADLERKTIAINLHGDYSIEGSIDGSKMTLTGEDGVVTVLRKQ